MQYPSKCSLKICFSLGLLLSVVVAQAITPVTIKNETADYLLDIKYPQGFQSADVNSVIKNFIDKTQKQFIKDLAEDADTPVDAPGKTGLNITIASIIKPEFSKIVWSH